MARSQCGQLTKAGSEFIVTLVCKPGLFVPHRWPSIGRGVAVHWEVRPTRASQGLSWRKDGGPGGVDGEGLGLLEADLWTQAVLGWGWGGAGGRILHQTRVGLGAFSPSQLHPQVPQFCPHGSHKATLLLCGLPVS